MNGLSGPLWMQWEGHVDSLLGLALLQGVYLLGVGPLRERYNLADSVSPRQIATFTAGVITIFVALTSPLHILSEQYLFSMHMVQHILLAFVAAPLLIMGTPDWLLRPLLRPNWTFRLARYATHPIVALGAFNIIFSMWHIPALYNGALTLPAVHGTQHILLIATAVIMWWPLASNMPELPRISYPFQLGYLFLLSIAQIIVFGIITFSSHPLYEFYVQAPRIWNLSPLADQQIGGVIMKVGTGMIFLALFIIIFFKWYNQEEKQNRAEAEEHYGTDYYQAGDPTREDRY